MPASSGCYEIKRDNMCKMISQCMLDPRCLIKENVIATLFCEDSFPYPKVNLPKSYGLFAYANNSYFITIYFGSWCS